MELESSKRRTLLGRYLWLDESEGESDDENVEANQHIKASSNPDPPYGNGAVLFQD